MTPAGLTGLDAALARAAVSRFTLTSLLVAYDIPAEQLPVLLILPTAVDQAVNEHKASVERVARFLAAERGDQWVGLPLGDKLRYQREAFEMIESAAADRDRSSVRAGSCASGGARDS
jgi:hypothetical protein